MTVEAIHRSEKTIIQRREEAIAGLTEFIGKQPINSVRDSVVIHATQFLQARGNYLILSALPAADRGDEEEYERWMGERSQAKTRMQRERGVIEENIQESTTYAVEKMIFDQALYNLLQVERQAHKQPDYRMNEAMACLTAAQTLSTIRLHALQKKTRTS